MKKNRLMSVVVIAGMLLPVVAAPGVAGVQWADMSLEDAKKRAKAENKHVFIDFYTTWCGPCKEMDKVTYTDEKVADFLNGMVAVKWDSEKGKGIELSKAYRVNAWPTMILLDPKGREIDRHLGFLGADDFLEVMTNYKNGINTVAYYRAAVEKDPKNRDAWKTLGVKHAEAGRLQEAKQALDRFVDLTPDLEGEEKAEVLFTLAEVNYDSGSYDEAARIFDQLTKEFADTEWNDRATTRLARSYHKMGRTAECIDTYMAYVNRHPGDPRAMNSFAWFCATRRIGFDEALPVALKAVELSGRDPGYLDTLAELYYAMEEYDKAIEVGREALEKEPEDTYFSDQLKKFKKAKEEAEGQAKR